MHLREQGVLLQGACFALSVDPRASTEDNRPPLHFPNPRLLPQGKRPWCVPPGVTVPWSLEPMGLGSFTILSAPILNVSVSLLNTLLVTYMDRIECLSTCLNLTVRKRSLSVALDQVWQNKQDRNLSRPLGLQTSVTKVPAAHVLGLQGQAVYPAGADPRLASHLQKTLLRSGWAGGVSFPAGRPAFVCY